jgi:Fe-S oxidoreductase
MVLGARVRLVYSPPGRSLLVLGYPDVYAAGDHICEILEHGPIGLEGIDDRLVSDMKAVNLHPDDVELLPAGRGWLMVEFGGADRHEARERAQACMTALCKQSDAPSMKLFDDPHEEELLWTVRKSGLGATAHIPNKPVTWEGWEDSAVPPEKLGSYLRELRALLDRFGYNGDLYGHFGQGCVHTRIDFDLETAAGIGRFRAFLESAANLVVRYGGSISGEHGDGQSKADLLPTMFGPDLVRAFGEFKAIWDPQGRMNPGKVVHPYSPRDNLRLGTHYNPKPRATEFAYPKDAGNFGRTMLRCVGVGECRRKTGKTMCPSYRATLEEKHSTRGRARLLFEMMRGDVLTDGWREAAVKDSLDLCLACKGCLGDCPVHVDMATYKAEFLSHYYEGRLRPRAAYAFGIIDRWAHIASRVPGLTNALGASAITGPVLRALAGIAPERRLPKFAPQSFQRWFRAQPFSRRKRPQVLLWPDTFNNYFHPDTARAALRVLDAVGFDVTVPNFHVCCGRPLYDFGMLARARRYLQQILEQLGTQIDAGIPFVVLEPACAATFRHELQLLLPGNERAKRLAQQTFFFCEFLEKQHVTPFTGGRAASQTVLLHGHCHQRAIANVTADRSSLEAAGCTVQVLDGGCCGMAGSFGFEREKYALSQRIGELAVLPAVRDTPRDTRIVSDGFSCREQIEQATGRRVWHSAEVLSSVI